jgi:hypothetical protein
MIDRPSPFQWTERWSLLPKRTAYLFTLDLCYEVTVYDPVCQRIRLDRSRDPDDSVAHENPMYHVHGDTLVEDADDSVREVPRAELVSASDWLDVVNGAGKLHGYVVLRTDTREPLTLQYSGRSDVWSPFERNEKAGAFGNWEHAGSAFICSRQECSHPKYSWLVQRQLIGVGSVAIRRPRNKARWRLHFSYDMYSATSPEFPAPA